MQNLLNGELPTNINKNNSEAARHQLFHHYLGHKVSDIPGSKVKNSNKTVLECIVKSFNKKYKPETYSIRLNSKIIEDSLEDIRSVAHLAVWEATDKYIWGVKKKENKSEVHVEYIKKYDFCIFASQQIKFKLKTHLRLLNTNRICGKLPDSDAVRSAYSKLPKLKLEKKYLSNKDYLSVAKENNIELDVVKLVDNFITTKTNSGDEEIRNEHEESNGNRWDKLESEESGCLKSQEDIEKQVDDISLVEEFNKIKINFLNNISSRDKEILNHTKFKELNNFKELTLSQLGKKFKISSERVRQIAETQFNEFSKIIINNKKNLEI